MCRYEQWSDYKLTCGAVWNDTYTPTPFNFTTIDKFFDKQKAETLKAKLTKVYEGRPTATVVEVLENEDDDIRAYAQYLFDNDYAPYTAKQWGVSPSEIDPSVLKRVPLRFSYDEGYFDDAYQVMPVHSFTEFFRNLLNHENITVRTGVEALERIAVKDNKLYVDGEPYNNILVYTGALDELFGENTADFLTVHCVLSISIPTRTAFRMLLSSHILRKRALPESQSTRKFPSRM